MRARLERVARIRLFQRCHCAGATSARLTAQSWIREAVGFGEATLDEPSSFGSAVVAAGGAWRASLNATKRV